MTNFTAGVIMPFEQRVSQPLQPKCKEKRSGISPNPLFINPLSLFDRNGLKRVTNCGPRDACGLQRYRSHERGRQSFRLYATLLVSLAVRASVALASFPSEHANHPLARNRHQRPHPEGARSLHVWLAVGCLSE